MELLAGTLAFGAVFLGFWPGIYGRLWGDEWAALRWHTPRKQWPGGPSSLLAGMGAAELDKLCRQAGRPYGLTGQNFVITQWAIAGSMFLLLAGINVIFGLLGSSFGWYAARIWLRATAEGRQKQIELELPTFLDLWGLLVSAGESVESALTVVVHHHPDWLLSSEMRLILARVASSGLMGESLVAGARETGSIELLAVAEQVRQLLEGGGVPSQELNRVAERLRHERLSKLVQSVGAAAVVGIFPKLFGVFLSLTPVLAAIMLSVFQQL